MIRQRYENDASITLPTSQQPVDWTVGLTCQILVARITTIDMTKTKNFLPKNYYLLTKRVN